MVRCPGGITMTENTCVKAAPRDVLTGRDPFVFSAKTGGRLR